MCKVLAIADMSRVKDLKKLVNVVSKNIMRYDNDGFGWSALGTEGVFGERTSNSHHYYRFESRREKVKLPIIKETYNKFGVKSDLVGPGIFHGRTSTNHKNLLNTHPINRDGWSLIHNGVVTNLGERYEKITTNDTEDLVYYMAKYGMAGVEDNLSGYFAFAAIDPQGQMHIVRDSIASLFVAEVTSIGSYIFGTTAELIESVCKEMKWKCGQIDMLLENQHLIFMGNEMIHQETIDPIGYSRRESAFAGKSLGRELDDGSTGYGGWTSGTYDRDYDRVWLRGTKAAAEERSDSGKLMIGGNVIDASVSWRDRLDQEELSHADDASLDAYLKGIAEVTSEYEIFDQSGNVVDYADFKKFDLHTKMTMNIVKPNGDVLCPPDVILEEELEYGS